MTQSIRTAMDSTRSPASSTATWIPSAARRPQHPLTATARFGRSTVDTDCNDADNTIYPGAAEVPDDAIDQDCDGFDTVTCFVDGDLDTFGGTTTTTSADGDCVDSGESTVDTDCDDTDNTIYPARPKSQTMQSTRTATASTLSPASLTATWIPSAARRPQHPLTATAWIRANRLWTPTATTPTTQSTPERPKSRTMQSTRTAMASTRHLLRRWRPRYLRQYDDYDLGDGDCDDSGESTFDTDCNDTDNTLPRRDRSPGRRDRPRLRRLRRGQLLRRRRLDTFGGTRPRHPDGDCLDSGESTVDTDCNDADNTLYPRRHRSP